MLWKRVLPSLPSLILCCATALSAQTDYRAALSLGPGGAGGFPLGWSGGPPGRVWLDSVVAHTAPYAVRLQVPAGGAAGNVALTLRLPVEFAGSMVELRGWLKLQDVEGFAGLWLREDSRSGTVQFDNMQARQLRGTSEWAQHTIRLKLDPKARTIFLGALLVGSGTVWADDFELLVDGKPVSDVPRVVPVESPVDADREFDAGSGFSAEALSPVQADNVALLGRVWGFAKYHHPRVTAGSMNWDYELFRVLPKVVAAADRAGAQRVLAEWLDRVGEPPACSPCASAPDAAHLAADVGWIRDRALLGAELSARLERIHLNRPVAREQWYVAMQPAGNPDFGNEFAYERMTQPDTGYRLLALFRFWNIIEYWFPYRDVIGEDWRPVLREFVPRLVAASSAEAYQRELMQLIARVHDTHANLWSHLAVRPPVGSAQVPVIVRFIDDRAVVSGYTHDRLGPATGLLPGDVITQIAGARIDSLVAAWRPFYAASNEPTRLRDVARALLQGPAGPVRLGVQRAARTLELTVDRVPASELEVARTYVHDLPGPAYQQLSEEVAYLKLSAITLDSIDAYTARAAGAKVLVVDIRNYPSAFVVFALGSRLVSEPVQFARFTRGDVANPGTFTWTEPLSVGPVQPVFTGKVVVLVDEVSQSNAEYTSMALRANPRALVVGSTTAAADGNVSAIPLPGGARGMISGIGVFYPDRRPTQRIGIVPDLEVRPTLEGIRSGRDEVLEAGVSRALGRDFRLPRR